MQLRIETHQLLVHVLQMGGRVDASVAASLKNTLRAMTQEGKKNFIVDLREVSFIDSTGLGVLTSLLRAACSIQEDVCLVVTPDSVIPQTLSLVRFDLVFAIYDSMEDALAHFRLNDDVFEVTNGNQST